MWLGGFIQCTHKYKHYVPLTLQCLLTDPKQSEEMIFIYLLLPSHIKLNLALLESNVAISCTFQCGMICYCK